MKTHLLFWTGAFNILFGVGMGIGMGAGLIEGLQTLAVGALIGEGLFMWALLRFAKTFGPYVQNLPARDKLAAEIHETNKVIAENNLMIHARQELLMAAMEVEEKRRLARGDTHKEVA